MMIPETFVIVDIDTPEQRWETSLEDLLASTLAPTERDKADWANNLMFSELIWSKREDGLIISLTTGYRGASGIIHFSLMVNTDGTNPRYHSPEYITANSLSPDEQMNVYALPHRQSPNRSIAIYGATMLGDTNSHHSELKEAEPYYPLIQHTYK